MRLSMIMLIFLFLPSCSDRDSADYVKLGFKHDIVKLFPEDLSRVTKIYGNSEVKYNSHHADPVFIVLRYDESFTDSIRENLTNSNLETFIYDDECNLILFRYQTSPIRSSPVGQEFLYEKWLESHSYCDFNPPIPNMVTIAHEYKEAFKSSTIYVTVARKDTINEDYLLPETFFPAEWRHGYSSGYIVRSDHSPVFFWFLVW